MTFARILRDVIKIGRQVELISSNNYRLFSTSTNLKSTPIDMTFASYGDRNLDASPIIIMHGLYGSKQNWKSISKLLSMKTNPMRQVFAVDARNHGESPHQIDHSYIDLADDVAQFHRQHGIERSIVLGHSMGGRCMMIFALLYPELVEKLVVVDIAPKATELSSASLNELSESVDALLNVKLPNDLPLNKGRAAANEMLMKSFPDRVVREFILLNLYKKADNSFAWRINLNAIRQNFATNIRDFPNPDNKTYNGPVLFMGGTNSDFIDPTEFPLYQKVFPNSKLEMINAGHLVHLENPTDFMRILLEFVNE